MSDRLSAKECAVRAHVSERTVRRWIAEGKLTATRTADGWTVDESDLTEHLDGRPSAINGHSASVRPNDGQVDGRPHGRPSEEAPLLAALVRDLQRQNLELAGLVGSLQQRLMFAEDRIHALEAPREPTPFQIASRGPTDGLGVEMALESTPTKRPWWLRWLHA